MGPNRGDRFNTVILFFLSSLFSVPVGQISPHLLEFLSKLENPEFNDREWFAKNDAVYRYVCDNWIKFLEKLIPELIERSDETIPHLPPKDCVHRIYRDMRFAKDPTPYKNRLAATFCRAGRNGLDFGGYHIVLQPNNQSAIFGGWHLIPKDKLDQVRRSIVDNDDNAKRLKEIVRDEEFCKMFGEPKVVGERGREVDVKEWKTCGVIQVN